jgi:predicted RNase H-like HicB family nuclease
MAEPRTVTVPVVVERDEDGVWCAHAQLRPGVGAHGEGDTEEAALEDLREALIGLIEEFGVTRASRSINSTPDLDGWYPHNKQRVPTVRAMPRTTKMRACG